MKVTKYGPHYSHLNSRNPLEPPIEVLCVECKSEMTIEHPYDLLREGGGVSPRLTFVCAVCGNFNLFSNDGVTRLEYERWWVQVTNPQPRTWFERLCGTDYDQWQKTAMRERDEQR